ncbi:MAG TPA: transketolase [Candidatus Saccharibacteria bacterium]|nr:transketolase [Candidatus Saccharibacteria bacterium]HMR38201.1 transketolase [Candidatus Saccharibacteria bacterium]
MPRPTTVQLQATAALVRQDIITMLAAAGSGHPGGALGLADIVTALYFSIMNIRPEQPSFEQRDIFLLSNGHCAPVQYAAMARRGFFGLDELTSLRQFGSRLQGHPERELLPGIETTSGPLGCGVSQAAGMAYALQYLEGNPERYMFVITGDGELNEGNIWEALLFANKYKLGRLIVIVDRNGIQIDGTTEQVMPLGDLKQKWRSFGWHAEDIDGHNFDSIHHAIERAKAVTHKPSVIIAHTVPGKGVDFMERDYRWHGKAPNKEEATLALEQLRLGGVR